MYDKETLAGIKKAQEAWDAGPLAESLDQQKERKDRFQTWSGIPLKRIYTPLDLEERNLDYVTDIGFPGEFPNVRGIEPAMYRSRLWERVQLSGFGLAEETNKRIKYLIDQGQTGFYVALDLPTQIGYDADNPLARGEVGKVGVSIASLEDMERLFDGIDLSKVSQIRTTAMAIGPIMLVLFLAVAEKKGVSPSNFIVRIQNDVLKEFVARGTCLFPVKPSLKFAVDVIEYCTKNLPHWSPLSIAGVHMRLGGCTAVQELAFTLANAIAYIESSIERGLQIDDLTPQLDILMGCATLELFEEIAKLRALRKMWSNILRDRFGANNPESYRLRINSFASGLVSTAQEPLNNIVRIGIETLALALAGSQDIGVSSYDEPICTPSPEAAHVALRTSQIIAYETGVTSVVDPLGGSYYIESLTDELVKQASALLGKVDEMGGALAAIESGFFKREIARSAYNDQKRVENGDRVIIGVNKFASTSPQPSGLKPFIINQEAEILQKERIQQLKAKRDNDLVSHSLEGVREAARKGENTVMPIFEAVKTYATIGEISDALRDVWGEWLPEMTDANI
jgi:methylmalonyl-CoA mutase N-terminal domain/subunit